MRDGLRLLPERRRECQIRLQLEPNIDEFHRAEQAAEFILSRTALRPRIASRARLRARRLRRRTGERSSHPVLGRFRHFPHSTAIGHAGTLVIGTLSGVAVAAMQGRVHLYEGYSAQQVAFPVRVFARMGIKAVVLTNAAGGINPSYGRGALVVISDHINLQGTNPLVGPNDERFGPRFPDMTDAYNSEFRGFALGEADSTAATVSTKASTPRCWGRATKLPPRFVSCWAIGADLVGMSTVPEVIAARHMGLEVLAISCVTNMAAGLNGEKINHDEVLETGERVRGKFLALLRAVLPKILASLNRPSAHPPLSTGFTLEPHVRDVLSHWYCRAIGSGEELSRPLSCRMSAGAGTFARSLLPRPFASHSGNACSFELRRSFSPRARSADRAGDETPRGKFDRSSDLRFLRSHSNSRNTAISAGAIRDP